jgi:glycosyltransferase involved in cell wall biosynthesis
MKVCLQQFLGSNHSWSLVGQNIARSLIKKGHEVHLNSTNGYEYFPTDLVPCVRPKLDADYEMQLSYTAMKNFPYYLSHGNRNRFGIWNYETTVLPYGFSKYYQFTDKLLPSSNFSKKIFADAGIPESHMVVIPHGADLHAFDNKSKYQLKTKKKFKILANIAQPHVRKNIPGLLEAFGRAFSQNDDVCLVAKVSIKKQMEMQFDVDFNALFKAFKRKYPKHAEIEIITNFIPNIAELYNSCDAVFSMTHAECFWLPGIEGMAANKLVIAPNYGGQLDFMSDKNSLLIPGKIVGSPRNMQYWTTSPLAQMFEPDINEASRLLQLAYHEHDSLLKRFIPEMNKVLEIYSWDKVTDNILELCQ